MSAQQIIAYTWSGNLASFAHEVVALPVFTQAATGPFTLTVVADTLNGNIPDQAAGNSGSSAPFRIVSTATPLPVEERFDSDSYKNTWLTQPSGDYLMPFTYEEDLHALISFNTLLSLTTSDAGRRSYHPLWMSAAHHSSLPALMLLITIPALLLR